MSKKENATRHDALMARIAGNANQTLDFIGWVFDGIEIPDSANIVEVCCGTGKQTVEFAKRLTPGSSIYAFDIEQASLDHLESQLDDGVRDKVHTQCLDFNDYALEDSLPERIDVFFCSYGLYYNNDAMKFLDRIRRRLSENGQIIIVGPYGRNNGELFGFLEDCGVTINDYIIYTAQRFMIEVVDWMSYNFKKVQIDIERNSVAWDSTDGVFSYWKNSTFFDENLQDTVRSRINEHFASNERFINTKYIMKATAKIFLP